VFIVGSGTFQRYWKSDTQWRSVTDQGLILFVLWLL